MRRGLDKVGFALALLAALAWVSATVILHFGLISTDPIDATLSEFS